MHNLYIYAAFPHHMPEDELKGIQYSNVIFDNAPIGMAISNLQGVLLKVNRSFCDTVGYPEEELTGKKFTDITYPDDLEENLRQNQRVLNGEISKHRLEKRYYHKNGKIIHAIMTVAGIPDDKGKPKFLLAQVVDITERKQIEEKQKKSEAEFRNIFIEAPIPVAKVGLDGNILLVNRAFTQILGYSSDEIQGKRIDDISHPDDMEINRQKDEALLREKSDHFTMEKRYITRNGDIIHGLLKVSLITSADENYFLGQIVDITRIKQSEKELFQKNIELNKINQELDTFVYRSSHDLKGPVTSLKGLINLLEVDRFDIPYLDRIRQTVQNMEMVIGDIISFSQVSLKEPVCARINVEKLVEQLLQEEELRNAGHAVRFHQTIDINPDICSDSNHLYVILKNLLSNAFTYQDPLKKNHEVNFSATLYQKWLIIEVKDNGKGISQEQLPKIFNMFYRGEETSQGTGLGLYLVKESVSKLHGEIDLKTQVGIGSTFIVRIPVKTLGEFESA